MALPFNSKIKFLFISCAQIPKTFNSKCMIKKTLHPTTLFPLAGIYKGRQ